MVSKEVYFSGEKKKLPVLWIIRFIICDNFNLSSSICLVFRQKLNSNSNTNAIPKLDISNKIYTLSRRNLGGYKLIYGKIPSWLKVHDGIEIFHELNCPVKTCILTSNDFKRNISDLVLFNAQYTTTNEPRPPNQIYAMYYMESPPHSPTVLHPGKMCCHRFMCILSQNINTSI